MRTSELRSILNEDADAVIAQVGDSLEAFAGRTVLLTGAAGFLGTQFLNLFARLNDSGRLTRSCNVLAVDNFRRGLPEGLRSLTPRGDIALQTVDIVATRDFPQADFIIHAASIASPTFYRQYPLETMDANVTGLRNLLDHAVQHRPRSFLFFSSSEIYGDPDPANIPTAEHYRGFVSCTGPRACYDESKRFGETLCVTFHRLYGLPIKIVRPFNNYGPGLSIDDRRVLPDFFRDVLAGRDITLLSDGRATRTFCYVSDAISGYMLALLSAHDGEAFNIGSESPEISMETLAELVVKVSGSVVKVTKRRSEDPDYLSDNPQRRCPDLAKSRRLLGYAPRVALTEGLTRTYAYYRCLAVDGAGAGNHV
jgi:dTDP-glucose 4,6-dehydratase/UDP-glucuronate decarboxylase